MLKPSMQKNGSDTIQLIAELTIDGGEQISSYFFYGY